MPNKATDSYNLAVVHPLSIGFWDYESNGDLSPYMVTPASGLEVWWVRNCIHQNKVKRHRWSRRVDQSVANDFACPYCATSNARLLKGFNDLESQYPEIAKEWDYDKNSFLPDEILCKSAKKVWWLKDCTNGVGKKHSWLSPISRRTTSGAGCLYCRRKNLLTGFNDLETKFPLIAKEWHPNKNDLNPNEITAINGRKAWWLCAHGHEWESVISSRTKGGNGCPYCGNQKTLAGFNDLATTNPEVASLWSENNERKVTSVNQFSHGRALWKGDCGHEWEGRIADVTRGRRCPNCNASTSKPEKLLRESLGKILDGVNENQNSKITANGKVQKIDIVARLSDDRMLIVEYDGWYWHKDKIDLDTNKSLDLLEEGFVVIRVREISYGKKLDNIYIKNSNFGVFNVKTISNSAEADAVAKQIMDWVNNV